MQKTDTEAVLPLTALDIYEWNSLAISTIDFAHVTLDAIKPIWSDIFTQQTRVASDLCVSKHLFAFVYRHRYHYRGKSTFAPLTNFDGFYCKSVGRSKAQIFTDRELVRCIACFFRGELVLRRLPYFCIIVPHLT